MNIVFLSTHNFDIIVSMNELLNSGTGQIIVVIFLLVNIFSFFVMARDKSKARNRDNENRIPEGVMFFMATVFGGIGIYAGMFAFRHKTRKWYFQIGIPLLILQNLVSINLILRIVIEGQ